MDTMLLALEHLSSIAAKRAKQLRVKSTQTHCGAKVALTPLSFSGSWFGWRRTVRNVWSGVAVAGRTVRLVCAITGGVVSLSVSLARRKEDSAIDRIPSTPNSTTVMFRQHRLS